MFFLRGFILSLACIANIFLALMTMIVWMQTGLAWAFLCSILHSAFAVAAFNALGRLCQEILDLAEQYEKARKDLIEAAKPTEKKEDDDELS